MFDLFEIGFHDFFIYRASDLITRVKSFKS
jgi:hypothetical protein